MRQVLYALTPAVAMYVALFGCGILVQLGLAVSSALLFEGVALRLRGAEPAGFLRDASVVVLACLLALAVPPYGPWWVVVSGVGVAVLIGKHAFGGLGHNVFNPAMVGYIFLLLSFPVTLSQWPELGGTTGYVGPWEALKLILLASNAGIDAVSGATVLDYIKTQTALMRMQSEIGTTGVFGIAGGRGWEWVNAMFVLGGGWLLWRGVITWRLPLAYLLGLGVAAAIAYVGDPELHRGPVFHLCAGGALLAAFFVVTDPVSSATTPVGMLVFGIGAGLLTYVIRVFGHYPDGVAFAVVIMNACAPLIDRLTQPRRYGGDHAGPH